MNESRYHQLYDAYPYLKNPHKYKGSRPITTRSSWELKFILKYLDINENILEWGSESVIISYIRPDDNKKHRYFMDFNFKAKTMSGAVKEFWIEIKPHAQTEPPKEPKRRTKSYFNSVKTYFTNQAKWNTTKAIIAEKQAKGQDIEFMLLTEKDVPFFK